MTINYCGLNGQHRVMPLMCGYNDATYKNNTILKYAIRIQLNSFRATHKNSQ